jgi:tetratricopeptide (TPR) repeat protein
VIATDPLTYTGRERKSIDEDLQEERNSSMIATLQHPLLPYPVSSYVLCVLFIYVIFAMNFRISLAAQIDAPVAPVFLQIISLKTQAELEQVVSLLRSGRQFDELARKHSTHATAAGGGYWGPVRLAELAGEIRPQIERAEQGVLIQFFHPTLGYTVLRKLDPAAARQSLFGQALRSGAAHLQRGEKDAALAEFKKAVALDPNSAAAHQLLGQAYLQQHTYEAIGEAKSELVQALALDPSLIWARFYLARIYLDLGQPRKAKEQLEAGLRGRPNIPHLISLLGEANRQLGDPGLASEQNRRALEIDPSFFAARYYLGLALLELKQEDEAIQELEAAVKSKQPIPDLYLTLGSIYAQKGDLERAAGLYRMAAAAAPDRPEGHIKLGQVYRRKRLFARALEELRLALPEGRQFPSTPYYQQLQAETFLERGMVFQEQGVWARALENYLKAIDLKDDYGLAYRQSAEASFHLGEYARALEYALKADELKHPIEPSLREKIQEKVKQ